MRGSSSYRASGRAGFTLVEIMIVVAIIGLLAALALPSFLKSRRTSRLTACLNDLRIYQGALDQYIFAHQQYPTDLSDLVTEEYLDRLFECPEGGAYEWSVNNGNQGYHLKCGGQHSPTIGHVCIHEDQTPEAK